LTSPLLFYQLQKILFFLIKSLEVWKTFVSLHCKPKMKNIMNNNVSDYEARKQSILNAYESVMNRLKENEQARMDNYYNCVDDYSWGSPWHREATALAEREATVTRDLKLELLDNGYNVITTAQSVLIDFDGNVCAEGTRYGDYGSYFTLFSGGFVSVAKKQATFEKKGFRMGVRKRTYKGIFTGKFSKKGNALYESLELVSEDFELTTNIDNYNTFVDWLYAQKSEVAV
jgi:hypothetical protein